VLNLSSLNKSGFTLVEIAIVITIIGILIGGVLKGEELLRNARITRLIKNIQEYEGAAITFRDKYSQIPGDMSTATNRLSGCNVTSNCENGDGNSLIGIPRIFTSFPNASAFFQIVYNQAFITTNPERETFQFWKHLTLADLITGIDKSAPQIPPDSGITHPSSTIGGSIAFVYMPNNALTQNGHIFTILQIKEGPTGFLTLTNSMIISPMLAFRIDQKADNGKAETGTVQSLTVEQFLGNIPSECRPYDINNETARCLFSYGLNF